MCQVLNQGLRFKFLYHLFFPRHVYTDSEAESWGQFRLVQAWYGVPLRDLVFSQQSLFCNVALVIFPLQHISIRCVVCIILAEKYLEPIQWCPPSSVQVLKISLQKVSPAITSACLESSLVSVMGQLYMKPCQRAESCISCYLDLARFILEKIDVEVR